MLGFVTFFKHLNLSHGSGRTVVIGGHCIALLGMLLGATLAQAATDHRFSGFATLGVVSNSSDSLVFRRDVSQDDGSYDSDPYWKTDSLLGAQWQGRFNHQWDASVQLVAKERFNPGIEKAVEWAFIGYSPVEGLDLRLGRMGADIFTLSDYRQVGYAYPWVRPPQDFYGLLSIFHLDGMDIAKRIDLGEQALTVKVFYGNHDEKFPVGLRSSEHSRLNFDAGGISLIAEREFWKLRYTFAELEVRNNPTASLVDALAASTPLWPDAAGFAELSQTQSRHFSYHALGLNYDNNRWWLSGELSRLQSELALVPEGDRAYLSVGHRFDTVSVFALVGEAKPRREVIQIAAPANLPSPVREQLNQLAEVTSVTLNGVRIDQSSLGLGVRWDFAAKMALKLQVEEFRVNANGTNLWLRVNGNEPIAQRQQMTITSLSWDMLF